MILIIPHGGFLIRNLLIICIHFKGTKQGFAWEAFTLGQEYCVLPVGYLHSNK